MIDIGVSSCGQVWTVSANNKIYWYNAANDSFEDKTGGLAKQISVHPHNEVWIIGMDDAIWEYTEN